MKTAELIDLLNTKIEEGYGSLTFKGVCCDCGRAVEIEVAFDDTAADSEPAIAISGGAVYGRNSGGTYDLKCQQCFDRDPVLHNTPCEVYSRVVGYLRPVDQWNNGKKAEFGMRREYSLDKLDAEAAV